VRFHAGPLTIIALAFTLVLTPFLELYLPKAFETGMHPFEEAMRYTPSIIDTVHVGGTNLLFGRLDQLIRDSLRPDFPVFSEHTTGIPLILAALFLFASIWAWLDSSSRRAWIVPAMAAAALLTWALTLHVRTDTAWWWVYTYVPGARATRVVARYQIFIVWPVVSVVIAWLAAQAARSPRVIIGLLCVLLVAEEINMAQFLSLDRGAERRRLATIPPPPPACRSFFAVSAHDVPNATTANDAIYSHNVDSMLVSEYYNIPTINGVSTFSPPDWNFSDPERADYRSRVHVYVVAHGLEGVCGLDLRQGRWQIDPFN
jgi:hypothetical protein